MIQQILIRASNLVAICEKSSLRPELPGEVRQTMLEVQTNLQRLMVNLIESLKGEGSAFSN